MLPTFFIIGAAKAGTTALWSYLEFHPDIHMSPVKEPDFFVAADDHLPFGRVSSLDRYERLFNSTAPVRGEASHAYSAYPLHAGVPERMHALVPDARLIYLVRDPIDRLRAWYIQNASWQRLGPPRDALGDINDPLNEYIACGKYMSQIERYLPLFGADRLLLIEQDQLRLKRQQTLREVFDFIGADSGFWTPEFDRDHNASGDRVRLPRRVRQLINAPPTQRTLGRMPEELRRHLVGACKAAVGRKIPVAEFPPELLEECREVLRPDAEALRRFTGRDFAQWSV